jgi:hypothetical protein
MSDSSFKGAFIYCSPPVSPWEIASWESTFPAHSGNWPLEQWKKQSFETLAVLGCRPTERVQLVSTLGNLRSAFYLGPSPTVLKWVSHRSTKPGSAFLIELTGDRGAALTTRYPTYGEDPLSSTLFIGYTKRHYRSWVKFSRDKGYGEHLLPILVSGLDMTKDFAIVAYSNDSTSVQSDAPVYTPMFSHGDASLPWTWSTPAFSYQKHGPSRPMSPDLPPLNSRAGVSSTGFDQCVFIRYYTVRLDLGLFPRVLRIGAGENRVTLFSELTVRRGSEPISVDEVPGGQWDPATSDICSEHLIIRDEPNVWFFARIYVSVLTFASRMKNTTVGMPLHTTTSR